MFAEDTPLQMPILHLNMTTEQDAGPMIGIQAQRHGWEMPADHRVPLLLRVDRNGADMLPTDDELALASQVLDAVCERANAAGNA